MDASKANSPLLSKLMDKRTRESDRHKAMVNLLQRETRGLTVLITA